MISDYLSKSSLDDVNTSANIAGAIGTFSAVHYAKESLKISKQLLSNFSKTHSEEKERYDIQLNIMYDILNELRILNNNITNMGGNK